MNKSVYVIGDVHGCYYSLVDLLELLPKESRKIFAGDLCDRGLYSKEVIGLVIENNYECVLGNHEYMFLEFGLESIRGNFFNHWIDVGGRQTINSYDDDVQLLKKHLHWIETLPSYILLEDVFITHGFGLPYFMQKESKEAQDMMLWNRLEDEKHMSHEWDKNWHKHRVFNIFGHTPYKKPKLGPNYCGIDTGCAYENELSAIEINSKTIVKVKTNPKDIK